MLASHVSTMSRSAKLESQAKHQDFKTVLFTIASVIRPGLSNGRVVLLFYTEAVL